MKRQKQVCKPLSKVNHLAYKYLEQVNKAIIAINYIGLEVKEIQFNHIKPRILVRDSCVCELLEKNGRAIEFGCGINDGGRYRKMQMMAEGIKVIWETNRIKEKRVH